MAVLHKNRNEVLPRTWLGNFPMRARMLPGCKMVASTVYKHRGLNVAILHPGNTNAKERDDKWFFLSLSTRTALASALATDSLTRNLLSPELTGFRLACLLYL